jgi:gamma-glutamylputrescine oxidase
MPVGTYIIATEPVSPALCEQLLPTNAAVCDNNFILDYFRFSGDHRMLFGGRVSYSTGMPRDLPELMRQRMVQTFPALRDVQIAHCWGGFVDISMNRAPDFGRLAPNLFYLQGFSGHGLALTGLAGQLVAEALHGTAARFDLLAQMPHRAFPGGTALRMPLLVLGTLYHRLKDSL